MAGRFLIMDKGFAVEAGLVDNVEEAEDVNVRMLPAVDASDDEAKMNDMEEARDSHGSRWPIDFVCRMSMLKYC